MPKSSGGDSFSRPTSACSRVARLRRSSSVRKLPTSDARPCDSIRSRLGCRLVRGRRSLTLAQCRENSCFSSPAGERVMILISESVTSTSWRWWRRFRLKCRAMPKTTISRPQNGRMGHRPRVTKNSAKIRETQKILPKNTSAERGVSEQFGVSTMRCSKNASATRCPILEDADNSSKTIACVILRCPAPAPCAGPRRDCELRRHLLSNIRHSSVGQNRPSQSL